MVLCVVCKGRIPTGRLNDCNSTAPLTRQPRFINSKHVRRGQTILSLLCGLVGPQLQELLYCRDSLGPLLRSLHSRSQTCCTNGCVQLIKTQEQLCQWPNKPCHSHKVPAEVQSITKPHICTPIGGLAYTRKLRLVQLACTPSKGEPNAEILQIIQCSITLLFEATTHTLCNSGPSPNWRLLVRGPIRHSDYQVSRPDLASYSPMFAPAHDVNKSWHNMLADRT